jgi:hypothetical protein
VFKFFERLLSLFKKKVLPAPPNRQGSLPQPPSSSFRLKRIIKGES